MISSLSDLECFELSYALANDIFKATKVFPKEEKYTLTDQVIRSSRSIAANIAEGWGKRTYENEFKRHLIYSIGSLEETKLWLRFTKNCEYLSAKEYSELQTKYERLGSKIYRL